VRIGWHNQTYRQPVSSSITEEEARRNHVLWLYRVRLTPKIEKEIEEDYTIVRNVQQRFGASHNPLYCSMPEDMCNNILIAAAP